MTEDFYDLLDVPPDASQDEIKEAYREKVRVYHPDLNDDDRAQAQFTAVKKAYDILGDPVERQAYDRLGHEDYVAKRTSGLPSPDVWKSDDSGTSTGDESESEATATTGAASSASSTAGAGASTSGTGTGTAGSTGTASASASQTASSASERAGGGGAAADHGGRDRTASSTDGGTTQGATRSRTGTAGSRSQTRGFGDNAVVRWWRRQNFSLPLIWLSVLVYLAGLADFALANASALEAVASELTAAGTEPADAWELLSSGRHGVGSSVEYLAAFEVVAPPLETPLWEAALAGVVGLTILALLAARVVRDRDPLGPVSIDETIVLALALTATTTLVGGPLLAGAVLMPVLFGVIVRHTRRGPGWTPSYLYLLPVLAPAAGFAFAAAAPGEATLLADLAALVILPLVGGLGLPLRATIRKRFGR